jgi:serine/threonine protein kinase
VRQSRLKKIFLEAAALPESDRLPMLERECAGDRALLADARALLASDIRGEGRGEEGELTRWLAGSIPDHAWDEFSRLGDTRPPIQPRQLRTSDMVGNYTITRTLGAGGSSSVYEAVRPGLDRPVALKVMHHALVSDHDRWRFEHEVRALSRLEHPSVARVLDFGIAQDERPFIVTERIGSGGGEGQAVPFARAAKPLSIPARLSMILTLCDAVSHAHQRGVIHRDLKSANVLVATDENGTRRPVIVDFGIARSFTPSGKGEPRTASHEHRKNDPAEAQSSPHPSSPHPSSPHPSDSPAAVRRPRVFFTATT